MSTKYKATEITQTYFITMTTVGWIDIFTRLNQKYIIINALKYCQENKRAYYFFAYCLMHSHLHLLCRADANISLAEIMRDFKKYTSKNHSYNYRRNRRAEEWLLNYFKKKL